MKQEKHKPELVESSVQPSTTHIPGKQVQLHNYLQLKNAEGNPRSIRFIDQASPLNNAFHVVDRYVGTNVNNDYFKPDLLLLINGLPLSVKAAALS